MGICPLSCSGRRAPVKGRYPPLLLACNALPDGHERLDLCELFLPNAADGQQLPHGFEIAVFRPVINDALRKGAGPIPGSCCSSASVAVLMLMSVRFSSSLPADGASAGSGSSPAAASFSWPLSETGAGASVSSAHGGSIFLFQRQIDAGIRPAAPQIAEHDTDRRQGDTEKDQLRSYFCHKNISSRR